jgi:hypothetical protein
VHHVEVVDRELRQRPARRPVLVPAPGLWGQFEGALVGKVRFDERHAAQFARIDRLPDHADAGHQAGAVAHGDRHAVRALQLSDAQSLFQRVGDRFFRIDVFFRRSHLLGERPVLLVGNGEDHATDRGIGEHRVHVGHCGHAHFLLESGALFLGAAVARNDLDLVRFGCGTGQDLGPAAQAHDADSDRILRG